MTLNLKFVAFVFYVSLFSGICIVILATFGTFVRLIRKKEPHVDLRAAGKNKVHAASLTVVCFFGTRDGIKLILDQS